MKKHIIFILAVVVFAAIAVTVIYFVNENDKKLDAQKIPFNLIMVSRDKEIRSNIDPKGETNLLASLKAFSKAQSKYFPFKYDKKTEKISIAGIAVADADGEVLVFHNIDDPNYYDANCGETDCTDLKCKNKIIIGEIVYRLSSKKLSELPINKDYTYVLAYREC